jgi:hypothetical protein
LNLRIKESAVSGCDKAAVAPEVAPAKSYNNRLFYALEWITDRSAGPAPEIA